jgi:hypothetical protein
MCTHYSRTFLSEVPSCTRALIPCFRYTNVDAFVQSATELMSPEGLERRRTRLKIMTVVEEIRVERQ